MAGVLKVSCMLVIAALLAAAAAPRGQAITCGTVVSSLQPCLPYVMNNGPLGGCCGGIKGLYSSAKTPADRKTVCTCLKSLAGQYSGANLGKAAGLPGKCGVNIPYKISPSINCNTVN